MIESLVSVVGQRGVDAAAFLLAFALTALTDSLFHNKLPHDHGREFAVNGGLSKGKARGSGLIFVLCIALVSLAFLPFRVEYVIYTVLLIASMLSGYFDDAAEKAWNEYKKGILDLLLAVAVAVTFLFYNDHTATLVIADFTFGIHPVVFGILTVILVWTSINVTNCTDGVDGLSATLTSITLLTLVAVDVIRNGADGFNFSTLMFVATLFAYLWFNANPSSLMMGDAGSRAMGMVIALAALKTGSPFIYIPASVVMLVDGGLGLVKVSMKRFLHIKIFWNIRTPVHDHMRKNRGWSNTQVDYRFAIVQAFVSAVTVFVTLFWAK